MTESTQPAPDQPGVSGLSLFPPQLAAARREIDQLDADLIGILAKRFAVTRRIGQLKADLDLPSVDLVRQDEQVARIRILAVASEVDPDLAAAILHLIVTEVVRQHVEVRQQSPAG